MLTRRLFAAASLSLLSRAPARGQTRPLTVFAAASLQDVLGPIGEAFTRSGGGPVRFSFAGSQALARQIDQGAPADVMISADLEWMDWLAERGRIVAATRRDLASNRLVIVAPAASRTTLKVGPGMPLARALGTGRLALADPTAVPAGKYARASLQRLGVWASVERRLAPSDNVRAALAFVARGETPLGVVYATDAASEPKVRVVGVLPEETHPRIVYPAAVVARAARPSEATAFVGYLRGPAAQAIFRKAGFTPLAR
jgi:molybdate transport system substrate-binding protein